MTAVSKRSTSGVSLLWAFALSLAVWWLLVAVVVAA